MTNPITPADLDELERKISGYSPAVPTKERTAELIACVLDAIPALIAAARERDALRVELEVHKGANNKLRSDLAAEVRRLRAELDEAQDVLVKLEWVRDDGTESPTVYCPECFGTGLAGHKPDCALAAALWKEPTTPTGQEKS